MCNTYHRKTFNARRMFRKRLKLKYNYMDYSISQGLYIAIVENIIAKYNLNDEKK